MFWLLLNATKVEIAYLQSRCKKAVEYLDKHLCSFEWRSFISKASCVFYIAPAHTAASHQQISALLKERLHLWWPKKKSLKINFCLQKKLQCSAREGWTKRAVKSWRCLLVSWFYHNDMYGVGRRIVQDKIVQLARLLCEEGWQCTIRRNSLHKTHKSTHYMEICALKLTPTCPIAHQLKWIGFTIYQTHPPSTHLPIHPPTTYPPTIHHHQVMQLVLIQLPLFLQRKASVNVF